MPTAALNTFSNAALQPVYDAGGAKQQHVNLPASVTYARGTVLGEVTATPGLFKAYLTGSVDGSQVPKAILTYDCATDAGGNITVGGGNLGQTFKSAPAYFAGTFKTSELTGLDAAALTGKPAWNLVSGTVTDGILRIG
jgi:hypothetical protein